MKRDPNGEVQLSTFSKKKHPPSQKNDCVLRVSESLQKPFDDGPTIIKLFHFISFEISVYTDMIFGTKR